MNQLRELKSKQKKTIFVLISGRAGTGKTTTANFILNHLIENDVRYSTIIPFAIGVKSVAVAMGWNREKDEKGRKLLQEIGKLGRWYDESVWVKFSLSVMEQRAITPLDVVLMDDWRFPNEGKFIEELGIYSVYKVRIHAPIRESLVGTENYNDPSEISLPEYEEGFYDYFIDNNSITLNELDQIAQQIILDIYQKEVK